MNLATRGSPIDSKRSAIPELNMLIKISQYFPIKMTQVPAWAPEFWLPHGKKLPVIPSPPEVLGFCLFLTHKEIYILKG